MDPTTTVAFFKPTVEDRERIANGALIQLRIWGHPIPPVSVTVTEQDDIVEEWKATDLLCNACGAVFEEKRGLDHCGQCGHVLTPAVFARDATD